jgi:hypothetical protein
MAISRISAHSAQANSVAITTPTIGDVIVVFAHRDGSTTAPTLATGYTSAESSGANTNSAIVAWKISDGTETTSGTWTNATSVAVGIYRGVDPNIPIAWNISALAAGGAASTSMAYNTFTLFRTDGTSWVVGFGAHRTATDVGTNAPTGMASRSSATDIAIFDTGTAVSSWSTNSATVNANSGWRTYTLELIAIQTPSWLSSDPLIQNMSVMPTAETANAVKIVFPNQTLSNNCLVLAFTHDTGVSVSSVTDSNSVSWTAGPTAIAGGGTNDCRIYYTLGAAATDYVTVTLSGSVANFSFNFSEFKGVKTASAVDGTPTGNNAVATQPVQSGSVTTTQAGDLIYQYAYNVWKQAWFSNDATLGIAPDSNFALLAASTSVSYAAQYSVQAASGAIDPKLLFNFGVNIDYPMNSLTIAFKMDGSGTSRTSGIRIVHQHTDIGNYNNTAGTTWRQFPSYGNLIIGVTSSWPAIGQSWTAAGDVKGNTYTDGRADTTNSPQCFYAANAITGHTLRLSSTWTGSGRQWIKYYDVVGADPSPFDTSAFATGAQASAGQDISVTNIITPTTSNGLVIAMAGMPSGPSSGLYSPSSAINGNHFYTGETDAGFLNNGDFSGHLYNVDTTAETWSWHMANPSLSQWNFNVMSFKADANSAVPNSIFYIKA